MLGQSEVPPIIYPCHSLLNMLIVKPRKLKHGLRMIRAGIPSTSRERHKDT